MPLMPPDAPSEKSTPRKLTPMMQRYMDVKGENPGSLLLFRMGDFYELFYDDAQVAAKVLGLTLTSRDKGSTNPVPMAGFPYHALEGYLAKLIKAGHRAAICEQVEDPKEAKGLVKREVTRIVTPGTLTDDALLDPKQSNFLAAIAPLKTSTGLAWLELSTGHFCCMEIKASIPLKSNTARQPHDDSLKRDQSPQASAHQANARCSPTLLEELARIRPSECLIPEGSQDDEAIAPIAQFDRILLSERPPWCFSQTTCEETLHKQFGTTTLEGFDIDGQSAAIIAAGVLLDYVNETQKSAVGHITRLEPYRRGTCMMIDEATRRSLELTHTLRSGERKGSLLDVIDETVSPMGARLLADWLSNPLTELSEITARHDAVAELTQDSSFRSDLRGALDDVYDLQRLTARVATGRANPRDLGCLAQTLAVLPKLKAKLADRSAERLTQLHESLDLCADVRSDIDAALVDEPPLTLADGNVIRTGYHAELDELRSLAKGGKEWIAAYQKEQIERTGISNLKVGFNKVFGYYLEVTATNLSKVPDDFIRKQTLKNQERYITPELKEYEDKVLRSEGRAISLEQEMFTALRERVNEACGQLQQTAEVLAEVDVLSGLATLAVKSRYCRPEMTDTPILDIREGRHPVLDRLQPSGEFVPNDVVLGDESGFVQIITGPNMAGKSTYIRQAALLTIMAQIGSFIPATEARIGIADRVFARVGASDELGKGQSTFMVEMTETARILNSATDRSLVILDEIGRGTSTYDGVSLAWAITEHLHDQVHARTLFATHYHELTELTTTLSGAANWNVAVLENKGEIVFLHRIVEGAADRSYGIHVARLAGVPPVVIERAAVILEQLEDDHVTTEGRTTIPARPHAMEVQLSLFEPPPHPLLDELRGLNLNDMTPLAALNELHRLRDQLQE